MIGCHLHTRRGAALLLVLAALVLSTVACAIAADSASTLIATRHMDRATRLADELLLALDAPVQEWLRTTAPTAVLPPDAEEPRFAVLHDAITLSEFDAVITITAFDQCGMLPWQFARESSPLASTLPPEVESVLASIEADEQAPFGLDAIRIDREQSSAWRLYPLADAADPVQFGASLHGPMPSAQGPAHPALGSIIATHSPGAGAGRINVNTAPQKLLEAAMLTAGRGGIEAILQARERGEAISFASRSSRDSQQSITIVSRSDVWSFRIDIRIGPVTRSWWCVYESGKCVQRLVIPE